MKKLTLNRLVRCIATYHFLSSFVVLLLVEVNGASGRSHVKTKLLLQNIRTHLAQKADEIVKEKECESGLILCKDSKSKEEEGEGGSEEIRPPPKLTRAQHKPIIRVRPKEVVQTFIPKAHKGLYRKSPKGGEREKHWKILHSPVAVDDSEADDQPKEETFGKDRRPAQETTLSSDLLKKPIRKEHKLQDRTPTESPKVEKRDLKDELTLQNAQKILKRKAKLEQEETSKKSHKTMKEDKKLDKEKKDKIKSEAKIDEREPVEEAFAFPTGTFVFVLGAEDTQRNSCRKHTQFFLKQLSKFEVWALMMYDASAKLAPGVLQGNTNQYGDFDECLSVNVVFKKSKNKSDSSSGIKGKYCLANIDMRNESKSLRVVRERVESFRFIKSTIRDPGHFIPRFSTINWGLCVPSACLAEDVEKFLKSRFDVFSHASGVVFDVRVDEDNCVVKDDLTFRFHPEAFMTILFYLAMLTLSLYATYFDAKAGNPKLSGNEKLERRPEEAAEDISSETGRVFEKRGAELSLKEKGKSIVMAFSLKRNVGKLFGDRNTGCIECIDGIKSIFTILLYFAHKTIPLAMTPFTNRTDLTKISNQPITVLLRASIVYTDSFLLISGMLTAYGLAKELSEKKEISYVKKAMARFIRLTPPLLAVMLFYAYLWDQMGSGPMWNLVVKRNSVLCRQHMWRNLLYVQNLFAFENMCAPQTHQLALDMQLSLLAPLFVHLMYTYDKVGIGALQALFILSSIMRYITTASNDLSVVIYHGMPVTQLYKTANLLYAQAFYRASPYLLGTVVGYHLKKFENRVSMPKAVAAVGWTTALIFGYYSLASPSRLASRTYRYDVHEAAQYAALSPVAWSLALSWVIVACHLGLGGKLNEFLCQKTFLVFSRISYSVYLTQFLVFFYEVGVKKIPEMFTFANSLSVTEFFIVIAVSVILTLIFDIPMMEIKKIILDEKVTKVLPEEPDDLSESSRKEDSGGGETISGEDSQETADESTEDIEDEEGDEDEGEEEAKEADLEEGIDENADEQIYHDNDEIIEAVFEIRPLKRSSRMRFSDESEERESFKVEPGMEGESE